MYAVKVVLLQAFLMPLALSAQVNREDPPPNDAEFYELYAASDDVRATQGLRNGEATNTHSCRHVRDLPDNVRAEFEFSQFFQRYTEAYGIPIVTSSAVTDAALQRACYTARCVLADWYAVRQGYYKRFGRFALIAQSEMITDMPEYSHMDKSWNNRARGFGATTGSPVSTGAEENALCEARGVDKWWSQDIVLHEYAHGMHLLGARFEIENFQSRLLNAYFSAKKKELWSNTYAMSTANEYFAEAVGSYFDQNYDTWNGKPNGIKNHVDTREELKEYDPTLYELVEEVFPCKNEYIDRCDDKSQEKSLNQRLRINAPKCKLEAKTESSGTTCVDKSNKCALLARRGKCANKKTMRRCMKTCEQC